MAYYSPQPYSKIHSMPGWHGHPRSLPLQGLGDVLGNAQDIATWAQRRQEYQEYLEALANYEQNLAQWKRLNETYTGILQRNAEKLRQYQAEAARLGIKLTDADFKGCLSKAERDEMLRRCNSYQASQSPVVIRGLDGYYLTMKQAPLWSACQYYKLPICNLEPVPARAPGPKPQPPKPVPDPGPAPGTTPTRTDTTPTTEQPPTDSGIAGGLGTAGLLAVVAVGAAAVGGVMYYRSKAKGKGKKR